MITIFNMEKISISNHLLAISSQHSFPPIYWQCKRPPLPFYSWATWGHMMSPPVKCLEHTAFPTESITKLLRLIVEVQACSPSRHVWNMMHKINGKPQIMCQKPSAAPPTGARDQIPRTGGWRGGRLLTHNLWFLLILCIMFQTCLDGEQAWTSTNNRKSFVMDSVGKAVCSSP